jgi:uncharacterized protein
VRIPDPAWRLLAPERPTGAAVLVLAGSSGRVDVPRASVLRDHGATVLAIRWFGGPGQQPGPFAVPLELFLGALDVLAPEGDRLGVVGTSFGAEAALLVAGLEPRITATAAFAPSAVVWPGWDGERWTSHWTLDGTPLPFVPLDPRWTPADDPPSFLPLYEAALDRGATEAAEIPVERIRGDVLLVAGGDDRVWPSVRAAASIAARRRRLGLATEVVVDPDAGHRAVLPGEAHATGGMVMRRGGTSAADARLGERAWPPLAAALGLRP